MRIYTSQMTGGTLIIAHRNKWKKLYLSANRGKTGHSRVWVLKSRIREHTQYKVEYTREIMVEWMK